MAQASQDPALGHQDGRLHRRLVAGLTRPRRDHHGAIVFAQLLVGAVHPGLVTARAAHPALELVGNPDPG